MLNALKSFKAGENILSVQVTFNRAVSTDSIGAGNTAAILVETMGAAAPVRLPATVNLESPTVARLTLREPFKQGAYRLTCLGTQVAGGPMPLLAVDDGSALDGDYDNQPGADFRLTFGAQ